MSRATPRHSASAPLALAAALLTTGTATIAVATPAALTVKVIHASTQGSQIDPKLEKLAKELAALKFSSFRLHEEAKLSLGVNDTTRMRLPGGQWMGLRHVKAADAKLRLEIEIKKMQFKTTVAIAPGATVALRGPAYDGGTLILAITSEEKQP